MYIAIYMFLTQKPDDLKKPLPYSVLNSTIPQADPLVVRPKIINAAMAVLEFPI